MFATQNPVEYEGTYPLPEAQLDRFLFKVVVGYPAPEEEDDILAAVHKGFDSETWLARVWRGGDEGRADGGPRRAP